MFNLPKLDWRNIPSWPLTFQAVLAAASGLILVLLGYWVFVGPKYTELEDFKRAENDLKLQLQTVYKQSLSLNETAQQVTQLKQIYQNFTAQIPAQVQLTSLLENISRTGASSGVNFTLLKPLAQEDKKIYYEIPMRIVVTGEYPQFARFISALANENPTLYFGELTVREIGSKDKNDQMIAGRNLEMDFIVNAYYQKPVQADSKNAPQNSKNGQQKK